MPSKSYSVRISQDAPDVDSAQAATWLDDQIAAKAVLAPDPGPGEKTIRLSLDADKVKAGAKEAREPEAVFLRRLIATNVTVPGEQDRDGAKPKALVLRGNLKLRQEQLRPLVGAYDGAQSFIIRRALRCPDADREAAMTEVERDRVAAGFTEVLNRRAPRKVVENIDLAGLGLELASIAFQKIDAVKAPQVIAPIQNAAAEPSDISGDGGAL
jgi:hypothetical protein